VEAAAQAGGGRRGAALVIEFGTIVPPTTVLRGADPHERGVQRGQARPARLATCWAVYSELFAVQGISEQQVRSAALECLAAVDAWAPYLGDEVRGTAEGGRLEVWQVAALNARTEILSLSARDGHSPGARPGECSTVISTAPPAYSMQTWDWHVELAECWHLQWVETGSGCFVGLTEEGILAKVGVNDAGVAVHLNVLGHQDDGPGAVPVHLAAAHVLHQAGSLDEAVDLLLDAPVRSSSALSVVTEAGAVMVELSPHGAAVVRTDQPYQLHTNHFLDARLALGEKSELYQPDSGQRLALLEQRCDAGFAPEGALDLVGHLCSAPGDGADLCCLPDPGGRLGERWATLATVAFQPRERSMLVSPGTPAMVRPAGWYDLECAFAPDPDKREA
jgi:isopenicillin-N N-acyltransferase-like protein